MAGEQQGLSRQRVGWRRRRRSRVGAGQRKRARQSLTGTAHRQGGAPMGVARRQRWTPVGIRQG